MVCLMVCLEQSFSTGQFHLLLENIQSLEGRALVFRGDELDDDVVHTADVSG